LSQTRPLYQLQLLDSKIDKAKRELAQINAQLGENEALTKARAGLEAANEQFQAIQKTMRNLESEVKTLGDKISSQEKLLYSGKALSAKEAANLQDEVASLKRWHGSREELLLETMVEAEEKEEHLTEAKTTFATVEATWQAEQGDLLQRRTALEAEIATWQAQRSNLVQPIEAGNLAEYEKLRQKKGGVAVAVVKDNICQSCGIMVSNSKVQRARTGPEFMYCGTCGRILHIF
jgi:predicted  nucleic acid-binding Zn-ribbon protein